MFDDDDPVLARVRQLALDLPGADEKVSHGRPAFYTKKVFAYYGGSLKLDGEWVQHPQCVVVKPEPLERAALEEDPAASCPPTSARPDGSEWISTLGPTGPRSQSFSMPPSG